MLTTEIKVNGVLIAHIYVVNKKFINNNIGHEYEYEVYYVGKTRKIKRGEVYHKQSDGALKLINLIINDVEKK